MSTALEWPSTHISLLVRVCNPADQEAWSRFVDLYGPPIYQFCRMRGLQHADASDVAQNVFVSVGRSIRTFEYDPSRGRFRSWLGLVIGQSIGRYRRKTADPAFAGPSEAIADELDSSAMAEWEAELNSYLFQRALAAIRAEFQPDVWQAFELVWLENVPPIDVARQFARKPQWVYTAKFKVLQRLREELARMAEDVAVFFRDRR